MIEIDSLADYSSIGVFLNIYVQDLFEYWIITEA